MHASHPSLSKCPSTSLQVPKTPPYFSPNPNSIIIPKSLQSSKQPIIHKINNNNDRPDKPSSHTLTKHWNTKIKHSLQKGDYKNSLSLYNQMLNEQITPNSTTFVHVLRACTSLNDLKSLRLIHNDILRLIPDANAFVGANLVDGYLKCGRTDLAHQVLDQMCHDHVVSWTMIMRHSSQNGHFDSAIRVFRRMVAEGVDPDEVALASVLSTVTGRGCLKHGMEVHGYLVRKGFDFNEIMNCSLVNMYMKLGKPKFAYRVFDSMGRKNVGVWTALVTGLINMGDAIGGVVLFKKMMNSGIKPNEKTMSCILRAVSQLGSLHLGIQVHAQAIKRQLATDAFVMSGLIDVYAKCATNLRSCQQLFDETCSKDVVSWTSMISAYGRQGDGRAALFTFSEMQAAGICPDPITFTSVLSACSSSGLLHEGLEFFGSMIRDYKVRPTEAHHACLVDLIARDGRLQEAYRLIENMDLRTDGGVWEAFLCACRVHGNVVLGEVAARRLMEIEPNNSASYILLSDIYSAAGRRGSAASMRKMLQNK